MIWTKHTPGHWSCTVGDAFRTNAHEWCFVPYLLIRDPSAPTRAKTLRGLQGAVSRWWDGAHGAQPALVRGERMAAR